MLIDHREIRLHEADRVLNQQIALEIEGTEAARVHRGKGCPGMYRTFW
jgi:hypothetical protein